MHPKIHPTAIISKGAKIADSVEIGPYSIIGNEVEIASGTIIKSHVVIEGITKIGENNVIFPFASIGQIPQDFKYNQERSQTIIGNNNNIREHATIHPGTADGGMITSIGNNCLLMIGTHVAHDCKVGNNVIMANNATMAGHVTIEDHAIIGGMSAIHQYTRIGKHAMIGGMSGVEHDVIPYGMVMGERAFLAGLNLVGMKRRGFSRDEIHGVRNFFKKLFEEDSGQNFSDKADKLASEFSQTSVRDIVEFIKGDSARAFCQPKKL